MGLKQQFTKNTSFPCPFLCIILNYRTNSFLNVGSYDKDALTSAGFKCITCKWYVFKQSIELRGCLVIHFHHLLQKLFTSLHCTLSQKAIKLSGSTLYIFQKSKLAVKDDYVWKNETPRINRSTFLQLWPSLREKIHKKLALSFSHISQNSTYLAAMIP